MALKIPHWLSEEQVKAFFEAAKENQRDYLMFRTIYFLGLRNSEVRKLKGENFDFTNFTVTLIQAKRKKDRIATLPDGMDKYICEMKELIGQAGTGYLFPGRVPSEKISERQVQRLAKKYAAKAGLDVSKMHPHTLRHSYATHFLNRSQHADDLKTLQDQLGHEKSSTTLIYAHMATELRKKRVSEAFKGFE
jgi:site-specific recombinase XerD